MIIIVGFVREPRPRARSILRSFVRCGMLLRNRLNHFTFMSVMICDSEKKWDRERNGRRIGTLSISKWFRDSPESTMVFRRQTENDLGLDFASICFGNITALLDHLRPPKKKPQVNVITNVRLHRANHDGPKITLWSDY